MAFHQPHIDPVLLRIWGPLQVRWYSLLYLSGFFVGRAILRKLSREERFRFTEEDVESLILWGLAGIVIGARVVYCVFYDPRSLMDNPLSIFEIYRGGLSFHGGFLGAVLTALFYARAKGLSFWNIVDAVALCACPGLFLGRIGNFLNGELWGRPTTVPWGIIFRGGGPEPRHPSQLYEAGLEGIALFAFVWWLKGRTKRDGMLSMGFLYGYCLSRFIVEFFREPDPQLGYLFAGLTMGQLLSIGTALACTVIFAVFLPRGESAKSAH